MAIVRCKRGHFYDTDKFNDCPYCGGDVSVLNNLFGDASDNSFVAIRGWKPDEQGNECEKHQHIARCGECGRFYGTDAKDACPYCGGKAACIDSDEIYRVDTEGNLFTDIHSRALSFEHRDPIEQSVFYKKTEKELEELLKEKFPPDRPHQFGECHSIWRTKQQILLERYHIRWRTPAEMNPYTCYD